jgi:predicted amidophosphoribosyltransferase
MPFNFRCAVFSNYSSRGESDTAKKSRKLTSQIKNGNIKLIISAANIIKDKNNLTEYLNNNKVLVPVPRSSQLVKGGLWPSKVICDTLVNEGLGSIVLDCLERVTTVPKSSNNSRADDRVSCDRHYETINVTNPTLVFPNEITLVDDVLTLGRTTMACARKIAEQYPETDIKIFTISRSMGLVSDITDLVDIREGYIHFGKTSRKTSFSGAL